MNNIESPGKLAFRAQKVQPVHDYKKVCIQIEFSTHNTCNLQNHDLMVTIRCHFLFPSPNSLSTTDYCLCSATGLNIFVNSLYSTLVHCIAAVYILYFHNKHQSLLLSSPGITFMNVLVVCTLIFLLFVNLVLSHNPLMMLSLLS